MRYVPAIERFTAKYLVDDRTGCWEWQGMKIKGGYGMLGGEPPPTGEKRKNVLAHCFSYKHFIGPIPEGMVVTHICDNPGCVNWQHLFARTQPGNMKDMERKGRSRILSTEQIEKAIVWIVEGWSETAVAERLGVKRTTLKRAILKYQNGDLGPAVVRRSPSSRYRKLTDAQAAEILAAVKSGEPISSVARRFDIDRKQVRLVRDKHKEN